MSLRTTIFFWLRAALKDSPQGPPNANRQPQTPPTANRQPPTANRQPPTANRQPPTANRHQPLTANRHPLPTATNRQPPTIVQYCFCGFASCPCLDHGAETVPVNVSFFFFGVTNLFSSLKDSPAEDCRGDDPQGDTVDVSWGHSEVDSAETQCAVVGKGDGLLHLMADLAKRRHASP